MNEKLIIELLAETLNAICEAQNVHFSPKRRDLVDRARFALDPTLAGFTGEYPDSMRRIWKYVRSGDVGEGIKVACIMDGAIWTGWVTFDDAKRLKGGKTKYVSVLWAQEA